MSVAKFEPGSWVWIEDEIERYLPAKVLKSFAPGEATTVETEDGEEVKLTEKDSSTTISCNEEALNSKIEDLIAISDLNEMSILHLLRIRFKKDIIYTNISAILVSVNPFKMLPLYTPEMLDKYRNGSRDLPPHVFGTAYNSYNNMLNDTADQSVVISGESGAGKSEATKLILQYLADVSGRSTDAGDQNSVNSLEQQILAANPILEAFGNAKTLRNNNSSRFGKLITVNFSKHGTIVGGGIINYLLEKSRVVQQTVGERNYHIFYQLLSSVATDQALASECELTSPDLFDYLNPKGQGVTSVDGISDEQDFADLKNSMNVLRFDPTLIKDIFNIVAGTLHFGNVKFKSVEIGGNDCAEVSSADALTTACKMWGLDSAKVGTVLTSKMVGTRERVQVFYSMTQALDTRDAMVKKVYAEVFQIIVDNINKELGAAAEKSSGKKHKFIGVLDIFGFESFDVNSFEQLCINFCNEKLQFHFNEHIFKMELALYESEGITISGSTFVDNQPTLDLLQLPGEGVFSMCDEEINVPRGTDETYLNKIFNKHFTRGKEHPNMLKPKANQIKDKDFHLNFGILHYAGPVYYNVTGFLEKNKDQLHVDVVEVLASSSNGLIKHIFTKQFEAMSASSGGRKKMKTLGGQFKSQLNDLIDTLNSTFPHFVRCMKSNDEKTGGIFASSRMQDQLRYAGLVEVCRIRKLGYPVRRPFDEFYNRFKVCTLLEPNLDSQLAFLESKGVLHKGEWAKGKTRVFMRNQQALELELFREEAMTKIAILVQKCARRFICRLQYLSRQNILAEIKTAIAARTQEALKSSLEMISELPYGGTHLALVKEAKHLLARVQEELRVLKLLEGALAAADLNSLKGAVTAAESLNPSLVSTTNTTLIDDAKAKITEIEALLAAKAQLKAAIESKDVNLLASAIANAQSINLSDCPELKQATALKTRIEQEDSIIAALVAAVDREDLHAINEGLSKCSEIGIEGRVELTKAQEVKASIEAAMQKEEAARIKLEEERKAAELAAAAANAKRQEKINSVLKELSEAMESRDIETLNRALQDAIEMGLENPEVIAAQDLQNKLSLILESKSKMDAALGVLNMKAQSGIESSDLLPLQKAIEIAREAVEGGAPFPELDSAVESYELYKQQSDVFNKLQSNIASKNRTELKAAVEEAEELQMDLSVLTTARSLLRDLELARREERNADGYEEEIEPYDEAEEARMKRQETAKQHKYDLQFYHLLRSPDDYARGVILQKSRTKAQQLVHQINKIQRSITALPREFNKRAQEIHSNLLGYMGDKQMPFPATLAQDLLRKGFTEKQLRDEIYVQIIKQVTMNPRPESVAKGWQLLCMCCGTFAPSMDFEMYLLHFIIISRDNGRGAIIDYSKYCLRTLEAMLSHGDSLGYVPQIDEILAFKERPPILATICLVDGKSIVTDMPVTPDTNVTKILECLCQMLGLHDSRIDSLGIFVYDQGWSEQPPDKRTPYDDLVRTPRPLRNEDFLGDMVVYKARQRRSFKFVMKRKIFLPAQLDKGDDMGFERLMYLQAEDEAIVSGNIGLPDAETVAYLSAISMIVCFGQQLGDSVDEVMDRNCLDFVPPDWRSQKEEAEWAALILQYAQNGLCLDASVDDESDEAAEWYANLQSLFVEKLQTSPMYGMHWFHVSISLLLYLMHFTPVPWLH
jgi:myosin heavy subunit